MRVFRGLWAKHDHLCILTLILIIGLLPRVWLLSIPNSDDDLFFQDWVGRILAHGLGNVYNPYDSSSPNYYLKAMHPPLNYYFLWAIGLIYQAFDMKGSGQLDETSVGLMMLVKVPNLLCDLLLAIIIFLAVRRRFAFWVAAVVLCLYWFNPGIIWEAGYIGQIEAVQTLPIVLAIVLLSFGQAELSWAAAVLAALTKPQGMILLPLIGLVSVLQFRPKKLAGAAALSLGVAFTVLLPWMLNGRIMDVVQIYKNTIDTYPYWTLNAANIWALAGSVSQDTFAIGGPAAAVMTLIPDRHPVQWLPLLSYKQLGLAMFAASYVLALLCVYRRRDWLALYLASGFIFFAFFMLPTQITERYLFPIFPIIVMTVPVGVTPLTIYFVASLTFMLNLYMVYPLAKVMPWQVVSNAKDYLPYKYLSVVGYRHEITIWLSVINLMLLLWLGVFLCRKCFGYVEVTPSGILDRSELKVVRQDR
jgi:hypothetical protein